MDNGVVPSELIIFAKAMNLLDELIDLLAQMESNTKYGWTTGDRIFSMEIGSMMNYVDNHARRAYSILLTKPCSFAPPNPNDVQLNP